MKDEILRELSNVPDVGGVRDWLCESDFFTAPASRTHHMAHSGGLAEHSWNVYQCLRSLVMAYDIRVPESSVIIAGLLHDVCKIGMYHLEDKWAKKDGKWAQEKRQYVIRDGAPLGHGEKSVMLLQHHGLALTEEEMLAIRWHMGAWDVSNKYALNDALAKTKLVPALQIADMMATCLKEAK